MQRLIPAGQQLVAQVTTTDKRATAKIVGERDGLNFDRSVSFDARTSKWLVPVLRLIADPRIASVEYGGKGQAVVTFVADTRADFRHPYPLEDVRAVLSG